MTDVREIRDLIARFAYLRDRQQHEQWADELVTADFAYRVVADPSTARDSSFQGRDEVLGYLRAVGSGDQPATHVLSQPVIDIDGGSARAATDFALVRPLPATELLGPAAHSYEIAAAGRYEDELVRDEQGRWRLRARVTTHPVPGTGGPPTTIGVSPAGGAGPVADTWSEGVAVTPTADGTFMIARAVPTPAAVAGGKGQGGSNV